jgi:hypothetical protein
MPRQFHPADFLYKTEEQRQRQQAEWEREEKRAELQEEVNRTTIEANRAAIEANRAANIAAPVQEDNKVQAVTKISRSVISPIAAKRLDAHMKKHCILLEDMAGRIRRCTETVRIFIHTGKTSRSTLAEIAREMHTTTEELQAPDPQ